MADGFDPDDLALAVGQFVLAFGELEHIVDDGIERLGSVDLRREKAGWPFRGRCDVLKEICLQRAPTEELAADASALFARLDQLREKQRNLASHGARRLMISQGSQTVYPAVLSTRFEPLSYEQILAAIDEARSIAAQSQGVFFHIYRLTTDG